MVVELLRAQPHINPTVTTVVTGNRLPPTPGLAVVVAILLGTIQGMGRQTMLSELYHLNHSSGSRTVRQVQGEWNSSCPEAKWIIMEEVMIATAERETAAGPCRCIMAMDQKEVRDQGAKVSLSPNRRDSTAAMDVRFCILVRVIFSVFTSSDESLTHCLSTARAMYSYTAAIPEELGFSKGDILAILRMQDDGWWEAELTGGKSGLGLVPSNYLQNL